MHAGPWCPEKTNFFDILLKTTMRLATNMTMPVVCVKL